jgi:hypothetical protein
MNPTLCPEHRPTTAGPGLEGIRRISLLYCYPSYFSEELIDAIANIDKARRKP